MRKYYFHNGQSQQGPYLLEELKTQPITPDTHIWYDTLSEWIPAGQLPELQALFVAAPPPFRSTVNQQFAAPPKFTHQQEATQSTKKPLYAGIAIAVVAIIAATLYFTSNSSKATSSVPSDASVGAAIDTVVNAEDSNQKKLEELEEKERKRQVANEARTMQNMEYRNNWKKYVLYSNNNSYRVDGWGGIYDLEIYVTNNTDKVLDEVVVTINYYKENGGNFTTKEISVYNIQPGTSESAQVPNTNRGTRFDAEISKITSNSLHFCYNWAYEGGGVGGSHVEGLSGNPNDPWFCK